MKGRVSGNHKRLAAATRALYVEHKRDYPSLRELRDRQALLDHRNELRRHLLSRQVYYKLRGWNVSIARAKRA